MVEISKGLLIGWKIGIVIHVISASILCDQLFVVGLFDLSGVGTAFDGEDVELGFDDLGGHLFDEVGDAEGTDGDRGWFFGSRGGQVW